MPYPKRFAGYDSPGILVKDSVLTRDQKISALLTWRGAVKRVGFLGGKATAGERQLIADIDRALLIARRG